MKIWRNRMAIRELLAGPETALNMISEIIKNSKAFKTFYPNCTTEDMLFVDHEYYEDGDNVYIEFDIRDTVDGDFNSMDITIPSEVIKQGDSSIEGHIENIFLEKIEKQRMDEIRERERIEARRKAKVEEEKKALLHLLHKHGIPKEYAQ
jgi:hypothetical protein